MAYKKGSKVFT